MLDLYYFLLIMHDYIFIYIDFRLFVIMFVYEIIRNYLSC